jgi:2',3'-cyclic-nucleotide 2'-phosphodiesterase (5'-nucleotidase family)
VLLGGHDHKPYAQTEGHTLIFKCGQNAYWLGQVDLRVEITINNSSSTTTATTTGAAAVVAGGAVGHDRHVSVYPSWSMIACRGLAHDPKCDAIIEGYQKRMVEEDEKKGGIKEDPNELLVVCYVPSPSSINYCLHFLAIWINMTIDNQKVSINHPN